MKDRNGSVHIINIHNQYHQAVDNKTLRIILFMDTKKAFDSIDHEFIHKILHHIGLPEWVTTIVHSLLMNVCVFPVLSAMTKIHIVIKRGVKQGCPLSPLLFVICYDILIYNMNDHSNALHIKIDIYAFADDIALSAISIHHLTAIMPIIDEFSIMSGLGLNQDKTKFISSLPFSDNDREAIINCPWDIKVDEALVDSHTYLGILMGRNITTIDIFTPALNKFKDRVVLFGPYLSSCNIDKRIVIFNVFLYSLFSYLIQFFIMPYNEIYLPIRHISRTKIIPFCGGGFNYSHLLEKKTRFGFATALIDLWAWSTAMLVCQSSLASQHGRQWCFIPGMEHVHYANWGSLIIPEHVAHMTMHFLHNYGVHDDDGCIDVSSFSDDTRTRRRQIYWHLVEKEYLGDRLSTRKLTSSLVYKVNKFGLPNGLDHTNCEDIWPHRGRARGRMV